MEQYAFITLRDKPAIKEQAAEWFSSKWGVPKDAYIECMESYLKNETEYGWYLCLEGERIIGGLGVIQNDFHNRKDLSPNVCAVYTEEEYRCKGIAGRLLDMAVNDLKSKGITPVYLVTDHKGFTKNTDGSFSAWFRETENRK
jgi:GNAT superfamily N-acetyltransferase